MFRSNQDINTSSECVAYAQDAAQGKTIEHCGQHKEKSESTNEVEPKDLQGTKTVAGEQVNPSKNKHCKENVEKTSSRSDCSLEQEEVDNCDVEFTGHISVKQTLIPDKEFQENDGQKERDSVNNEPFVGKFVDKDLTDGRNLAENLFSGKAEELVNEKESDINDILLDSSSDGKNLIDEGNSLYQKRKTEEEKKTEKEKYLKNSEELDNQNLNERNSDKQLRKRKLLKKKRKVSANCAICKKQKMENVDEMRGEGSQNYINLNEKNKSDDHISKGQNQKPAEGLQKKDNPLEEPHLVNNIPSESELDEDMVNDGYLADEEFSDEAENLVNDDESDIEEIIVLSSDELADEEFSDRAEDFVYENEFEIDDDTVVVSSEEDGDSDGDEKLRFIRSIVESLQKIPAEKQAYVKSEMIRIVIEAEGTLPSTTFKRKNLIP